MDSWKEEIIKRITERIMALAEEHYTHPDKVARLSDKVARLYSAIQDIDLAIGEKMGEMREQEKLTGKEK